MFYKDEWYLCGNLVPGKYQYKICAPKYCNDKSFDKDVSTDIDVNSLIVINEYIFVQVFILIRALCTHRIFLVKYVVYTL